MPELTLLLFGFILPVSALFWVVSSDTNKIERGDAEPSENVSKTMADMRRSTDSATLVSFAVILLRVLAFGVLFWSLITASRLSSELGVWAVGTFLGGVITWAVLIGFAEIVTCVQDIREDIRKKP